ncbi:hypothetical protein PIIN_11216 [Serendipita indica DSM 11827]|uniref:Uncharacterized protein n=1 Tax=Serendipita indica (strain DSM 11827) TaxID=1109443 RepID=G4U0Z0_SERID|nr:hypothetical protein PIIN_11216 [Serendipita indica DSM 11827]
MNTIKDLPVELSREIFELAIGESNELDPVHEPQGHRPHAYEFLHNENYMSRSFSSELDRAHLSSGPSSPPPMGATPISDKGPARGGSASKYSPSSSPTLRLSPTAFSPASSSDVPLSARLGYRIYFEM